MHFVRQHRYTRLNCSWWRLWRHQLQVVSIDSSLQELSNGIEVNERSGYLVG
jgi:hypothetical protein